MATISSENINLTSFSHLTITSSIDFNTTVENETITSSANVSLPYLDEIYLFRIYRPFFALTDKYFTILMYIIGFPGNPLAFVVWVQRRMRHSSGCYLAALACVDFVFLSLQLVFELHSVWYVPTLNTFLVCEIFPVFFLASQYLSPLLVLGFTFERFISVCYPFQRDRFCTTSRAIKVISALALASIALHSVQAYFWHFDSNSNDCSPREVVTRGGQRSVWSIWSWVTELLVFGVVPVIILVLNLFVIRETKRIKHREERELCLRNGSKKSGGGSASSSATTFMLLAVSFYLIFTTLPVTICYVLYPTFPAGSPELTIDQVANDAVWQQHLNYVSVKTIVQEIGMSHYACNVIIYLLTGRMFRVELQRLFCKRNGCLQQSSRGYRGAMSGEASFRVTRDKNSASERTTSPKTKRPTTIITDVSRL